MSLKNTGFLGVRKLKILSDKGSLVFTTCYWVRIPSGGLAGIGDPTCELKYVLPF